MRNAYEAQTGQIRVAMKKRLDMLSKLVDSVKSCAKFEASTLEKVTELRSGIDTASPGKLKEADALSKALAAQISVAVENYPELKTSETVKELMKSVKDLEEEIARQRYTYNNIAQEYNTMASTIPSSIVASIFGFSKLEYL